MVEHDLHISKRLKAVLPPLTEDERNQLEANIVADGRVTDTILFWHDGKRNVVADGMNRFEIARKLNLPYRTEPITIAGGYDEVAVWILDRQLGRRNLLQPQALRKVRGDLYNAMKATRGGDYTTPPDSGELSDNLSESSHDTAAEVAEKAGVSDRTIRRDGKFAELLASIPKSLRDQIQTGAIKATDAEVKALAKMPPEEQTQVAREIRTEQQPTLKAALVARGKIRGKAEPEANGDGFVEPRTRGKSAAKPPKQLDRSGWLKQWENAIGPLVRLVDKIANELGEKKSEHRKTVQEHLNIASEEMAEWLK